MVKLLKMYISVRELYRRLRDRHMILYTIKCKGIDRK